jgi:uncharacterized protein
VTRRFPPVPVLLALAMAVFQLAACGRKIEYPPPSDRAANDFAGLLAPQTVERLEKLSRSLWQQSRDAVVVVTVESIAPETIEGYAVGLFEYWGIGDEGTDNGILILVAEKERKTRIEVGYGLEGTIPDAEASRIVRDLMLPNFRRGDYNRGVELAVQAVIGKIADERGLEIEGLNSEAPAPVRRSSSAGNLSPLIFLLLVVLVLSLKVIAFRRRGTARGTGSGGFWTGSGGGFGGGFSGGFGGGMSGGGGASGGW